MLRSLFAQVLEVSIGACVVILIVSAARCLMRRAPAAFSHALWLVVLFRLLCPADFGISVSVEMSAPLEHTIALTGTAAQGGSEHFAVPYIWLAGVVVLLVWNVRAYFRLRRRLVGAACWKEGTYLADHIAESFVLGVFRPRIYLSSALTQQEREYIVCHEKQHIRRLDHIIKPLFLLALCIHWFNPLVWMAFHLMELDMEKSCDEAVLAKLGVEIRAAYAACLLNAATGRQNKMEIPPAFGGGNMKGRLNNMKRWKKPHKWVVVLGVLFCGAVMLGCVLVPTAAPDCSDQGTTICTTVGCTDLSHGHGTDCLEQEIVYGGFYGENDCADSGHVNNYCTGTNHHSEHGHGGHHE